MFKNDVCIHIAQRGSPTAHIGCSMLYPTTLSCQLLKNHLLLQTSCPQNNNYILIHRSFVFLALFNFHITLWNQHDHYASSLNTTTPTTADTYFVAIFLSHYSPFLNDLLLNTPPLDNTYTIIISKIICIHSYIHIFTQHLEKESIKENKGLISFNKYFSIYFIYLRGWSFNKCFFIRID